MSLRTYAILAAALALPALALGETTTFRPPGFEARLAALRKAGPDLVPLFILGDVNEDGVVDQRDADLMRAIVQGGSDPQRLKAVSCPAAADVNRDGEIDRRDLDLVQSWVRAGKVAVPALSFQSYLPCNFRQFFIAASKIAMPGGVVRIRFLTPDLTAANSKLSVDEGKAEVRKAPDGRGYLVMIPADARSGDMINLRIELPRSRVFFYAVAVGVLAR